MIREYSSRLNEPSWRGRGLRLRSWVLGLFVERFRLFLFMLMKLEGRPWQRDASFWVGISFILLGTLVGFVSVVQYRRVLKTLKPVEIPEGYWVNIGVYGNLFVGLLGAAIIVLLFLRFVIMNE